MSDITTTTHPMLTLADTVQEYLRQVENLLDVQVADEYSSLALALRQLIRAGGKRIRPRLVLLIGSMFGVDTNRLVHLAAAVEMLHTATLIHDDLIDESVLRRGMETLNVQWTPAATVLAGDFAFARAAELVAASDSTAVMHMFAESMSVMVAGEMGQLLRERGIANREEYYDWISAKTATLFELATGAAALLSQASTKSLSAAHRFGHEIGMAFQIMDDVLDFTGNPVTLGKTVGSDLRQGVITLPALYFFETHPDDSALLALIAHKQCDENSLNQLLAAILESGAIQSTLAEAQAFVERGLKALACLPGTSERLALAKIAQAILTRNN